MLCPTPSTTQASPAPILQMAHALSSALRPASALDKQGHRRKRGLTGCPWDAAGAGAPPSAESMGLALAAAAAACALGAPLAALAGAPSAGLGFTALLASALALGAAALGRRGPGGGAASPFRGAARPALRTVPALSPITVSHSRVAWPPTVTA